LQDSEGTEVNEATDDSGTEVEEVSPVNRTKYLFDSKDPYLIKHGTHPDNFQQELGQKTAPYKQETPVEEHKHFGSNTVRSNTSERVSI
jgi:hypothetical protein